MSVIVVGAGWTGAIVARRLAESTRSIPVLVLEGGARAPRGVLPRAWGRFERKTEALTHVDEDVWSYDVVTGGGAAKAGGKSSSSSSSSSPFEWLRVRAMGGRTLLWGGWMDRPGLPLRPWSTASLGTLVSRAERWLGVQGGKRSDLDNRVRMLVKHGFDVEPKRACLHADRQRPLTALDLLSGIRVRANTAVLRVLIDDGATSKKKRRVRGVEVIDVASRKISTIDASTVVLAASPLETFRILRESGIDRPGLGEGWSDHLVSGSMVVVEGEQKRSTRRRTPPASAPLDKAALVRISPRSSKPNTRNALGCCFEVRGPTPLGSLDAESLKAIGVTADDARRLSYFAVFGLGELDGSRSERRVILQRQKRDALGRPRLKLIVPSLSANERELATKLDTLCAEVCTQIGSIGAAPAAPAAASAAGVRVLSIRSAHQQGQSGHEVGGCRTGSRRDPTAIVDKSGAVHDVPGLYVADGSRIGRALDVHPSLTLGALALNTADQIVKNRR